MVNFIALVEAQTGLATGGIGTVAYRNGQVVHYKLVGGNHGLAVNGSNAYATEANQLIASFLLQ